MMLKKKTFYGLPRKEVYLNGYSELTDKSKLNFNSFKQEDHSNSSNI